MTVSRVFKETLHILHNTPPKDSQSLIIHKPLLDLSSRIPSKQQRDSFQRTTPGLMSDVTGARACVPQISKDETCRIMFWHLHTGPVIGGQAYRIPPLTTEAWEEMKILFDDKTGRVWPNAEWSEKPKCRREYVLKQFWQPFVDDRFDLENAIWMKAEFSCAIGGWEEENWVGSRFGASMWIYFLKGVMGKTTCVWVSELTISCQETTFFGSSRLWHRRPMFGAVEHAVLLGTDKSQAGIFEQWYDPREIQRSYQSGSCGNFHLTLR